MKLMVICASADVFDRIAVNIKPLGFELVHYRHVLKAMDNLDEVDPQAIIISARDFPRHWKALVQFVRQERNKSLCPIIILHGRDFSEEEAAKGFYIGVNGMVSENLEKGGEIDRLQRILGRYIAAEERRDVRRYYVDEQSRIGICIAHPLDNTIITGTVRTISSKGIAFKADEPGLVKNITVNEKITGISIRVGDAFIAPQGRLISKKPDLVIEFSSITSKEMLLLTNYLEAQPLRIVLKQNG
jgi:DNA-binding response OmpR family regulator